jgi:Tol biopolymer transport system component
VSNNGVLVHAAGGILNTRLTWLDRSGRELGRLALAPGSYSQGQFAPDGSMMVVAKASSTGTPIDLWLVDTRRTLATRFTFVNSLHTMPRWSPDGKSIVFSSAQDGRENIFVKAADSGSEEKRLFMSKTLFTKPEAWAPDGRAIIYNTITGETGTDLWLHPMESNSTPRRLLSTPFDESGAAISPDGRWMAYRSNETGRYQVYIRSFPDMAEKHRISDDALGTSDAVLLSYWITWRSDGKEILFPGRRAPGAISTGREHVLRRGGSCRRQVPELLPGHGRNSPGSLRRAQLAGTAVSEIVSTPSCDAVRRVTPAATPC